MSGDLHHSQAPGREDPPRLSLMVPEPHARVRRMARSPLATPSPHSSLQLQFPSDASSTSGFYIVGERDDESDSANTPRGVLSPSTESCLSMSSDDEFDILSPRTDIFSPINESL
ncbi:hypothetical protein BD414DRAFT_485336 [Trametes punicea]|nr:hypothetical protein BD414DRAFT_485336 [Trametes punicea]